VSSARANPTLPGAAPGLQPAGRRGRAGASVRAARARPNGPALLTTRRGALLAMALAACLTLLLELALRAWWPALPAAVEVGAVTVVLGALFASLVNLVAALDAAASAARRPGVRPRAPRARRAAPMAEGAGVRRRGARRLVAGAEQVGAPSPTAPEARAGAGEVA